MKKLYLLIGVLCLVSLVIQTKAQQPLRIVKVDGYDGTGNIETFNNKLYDAIVADSVARKTNPNVVFELNRGQSYPVGKTIKNYDYTLYIRAAAGTGPKPIITPGKDTKGTYTAKYLNAYNHVIFENIEVSGHTPTASVLNRAVEVYGKKSRMIARNCAFDGDRGGSIAVWGDSMKVYVYDCTFGNIGHRKTSGGNGRSIDLRPTALYLDSLIVQNSTHYNQSDRLVRNMNTKIKYLKWDHNTALNNVGFHGSLQLGKVKTAIVTNNIFANCISLGHYQSRTVEQTQPEKHFSIISVDTIKEGQNVVVGSLVIRNNNIYTDKIISDIWAKYDTVSAPWEITPTIKSAIGEANVAAAWFAEPLTFKTFCTPLNEYISAYFTNPKATAFPENWCVGGEGGYYADEINPSYGTTAISYTKADGGFPLGDLNFYPEKKAEWQAWVVTGISGIKSNSTEVNAYPNPFSDRTMVRVNISKADKVDIAIFDLTGKMVKQISNQNETAGVHEYWWDGDNSNGNKVNTGIYMYKVVTSTDIKTGSLIRIK